VRLSLKAKDEEPVRASVEAGTTVETLINLYRSQRRVAPNQSVTLMFDGERLAEHMTVAAADINDMDSIDVLVK